MFLARRGGPVSQVALAPSALFAVVALLLAAGPRPPAARAQARATIDAPAAADLLPGARLVASDASGVTFEVDVPEPRFIPVTAPNGTWQRLDLAGYDWAGRAGEPLVPVAGAWLAIPEGARLRVSAEGEGARVYEGVRLLPQQELPRESGRPAAGAATLPSGALAQPLVEDRGSYARQGYGTAPAATLDGIGTLRAQRVARVTVRPVAYDPAAGRVRVWSKVRVRVEFAGGATPPASAAPPTPPAAGSEPAFEDVYRNTLLNYAAGRSWRIDLQANTLRRRGLLPDAVGGPAGQGAREDFTSSPNWVRIDVPSKGVYKIDAAALLAAGVPVGTIDPRSLRMFNRAGVPLLDEWDPPTGWMSEIAIQVAGESDGRFDTSDYILFYGLGASGWKDDFTSPGADSLYLNHPYATRNVYWLTWDGSFSGAPRRWATRPVAPERAGATEVTSFPARQHFELDVDYWPSLQEGGKYFQRTGVFWEKWIWRNVDQTLGTIPFQFDLPNAVTGAPARLFARLWGNSREGFTTTGLYDHYLDVSVNNTVFFPQRRFYGYVRQDYDTTFTGIQTTGNRLNVRCAPQTDPLNPSRRDRVAFFWFDVFYRRLLTPTNNLLDFRSDPALGDAAYDVGPFTNTTGFLLLDTSDPVSPVQLTGVVERDTTGGKAVYFHDAAAPERHYLALTSVNLRAPDAIARVAIDDLRSPANGADYVVVTYDGFADAAQQLADYRATNLPGYANPRTRVVRISDIYAWYSGGRVDPTAIRNFFYDAVKVTGWSPAPSMACFLGDASYDFKNIYNVAPAGQPPALVPSYVNGWQTAQFMTDDWLVDLDLGVNEPYPNGPPPGFPDSIFYDLPDLSVGRIPASSADEARYLVSQKILPYDRDPEFGDWRMRALFIADDLTQGFSPDPLGSQHMEETENILNGYVPPLIETRKIWLVRYPYGSGSEKPAANKDVKEAVNQGMVFWNYIGHGNPFKMADENAFILSDVGALTNRREPTFLIAASCDLGKFDDPIVTGLGEALLKSRTGGAIAAFSASDIAFAFANIALAKELFLRVLEETPQGFERALGQAVLLAKMRRFQLSDNDLKYGLMGDPATRLALPRGQVRMTMTDALTGAPVDSLRRGQRVHVEGTVHASHDAMVDDVLTGWNGPVDLLVTDAPARDSVQVGLYPVYYTLDPGVIFRGSAVATAGRFAADFVVPLEALTGDGAEVHAYTTDGSTDGGGVADRSLAAGVPAAVDTVGPEISLAFANGETRVPPGATLRIVLRDDSGINLVGHTFPNALYLTIDNETRFDLTESFHYDPGSYQQGTVEFALPALAAGAHSITVSAADNYAQGVLGRQNRSTASIDFEVLAGAGFTLGRVYNFPNPFSNAGGTSFVLTGLSEAADVQVKIYTVSGSLVRILEGRGGPGQVQIPWDGRDQRGDRLANGAYLYQVQAEGQVSGRTDRYRGRAALVE